MQTIAIFVVAAIAVGIACMAVLRLNEKNMQEIEANQKEIEKLADCITELSKSQSASNENKSEP